MDVDAKAILRLLPYQLDDLCCPARFRWCCWSRQSGKSFTKSLRRIWRGLKRGRNQVFLSAGQRQSRELMEKARMHCELLQLATQWIGDRYFENTSYRQLEIVLPGGVRIIGLPANPQTARGFTGDVLLDEFAMHVDDREIWAAMFPTLLRGDGELDVCSTPKGCRNVFYGLRANPLFSHSTITLPDAIAAGLQVDLDQVRRAMNDDLLFRQEFLCEFLDEAAAFLTYDQIAACEDPTLTKQISISDVADANDELFVGVDVGRHRDLTVIWVLGRAPVASGQCPVVSGRSPVVSALGPAPLTLLSSSAPQSRVSQALYLTRGVIELANTPFREQQAALAAVLSLRDVRRCCIDAGGLGMQLAESAVEDFGAHRVEAITFTVALKAQLAGALRVAVEDRRIRIPADEAIRNDWHSLERSVSAGGHVRFDANRSDGSHADRFWAAALALHAAAAAPPGRAEMLRLPRPLYTRSGTW